jgi:hypothetical protein
MPPSRRTIPMVAAPSNFYMHVTRQENLVSVKGTLVVPSEVLTSFEEEGVSIVLLRRQQTLLVAVYSPGVRQQCAIALKVKDGSNPQRRFRTNVFNTLDELKTLKANNCQSFPLAAFTPGSTLHFEANISQEEPKGRCSKMTIDQRRIVHE